MLAENFFLMLETLISRGPKQSATYSDGAPKVISLVAVGAGEVAGSEVEPPDEAAFLLATTGFGCQRLRPMALPTAASNWLIRNDIRVIAVMPGTSAARPGLVWRM